MARNLHAIVLGALATVLALGFTWGDGAPGTVLRNRFVVSLLLLLPGTICSVSQDSVQRFFLWLGDVTRLSDDDYKRKVVQRTTDVGRWAVLTSLVLMLVSVVFWLSQGMADGTG